MLESKRIAERKTAELKKLTRDNQRRAARGLPPLEKGEKADTTAAAAEDDQELDILLDESVNVLSDVITLLPGAKKALVMKN